MPYIIETKTPRHCPESRGRAVPSSESRRAVATLDEARQAAMDALPAAAPLSLHFQCEDLTERGGTVGALPDGTVIEVAPIDYEGLGWELPGSFWDERVEQGKVYPPIERVLIDAFNAGQEA